MIELVDAIREIKTGGAITLGSSVAPAVVSFASSLWSLEREDEANSCPSILS